MLWGKHAGRARAASSTPPRYRGRPDSDVSSPRYACRWHCIRIPSQHRSIIDCRAEIVSHKLDVSETLIATRIRGCRFRAAGRVHGPAPALATGSFAPRVPCRDPWPQERHEAWFDALHLKLIQAWWPSRCRTRMRWSDGRHLSQCCHAGEHARSDPPSAVSDVEFRVHPSGVVPRQVSEPFVTSRPSIAVEVLGVDVYTQQRGQLGQPASHAGTCAPVPVP